MSEFTVCAEVCLSALLSGHPGRSCHLSDAGSLHVHLSSQVGRQHSCQFQIPPFLARPGWLSSGPSAHTGPVWGSSWV